MNWSVKSLSSYLAQQRRPSLHIYKGPVQGQSQEGTGGIAYPAEGFYPSLPFQNMWDKCMFFCKTLGKSKKNCKVTKQVAANLLMVIF